MTTYSPNSSKSFRISRSKVEDFIRCPRCFYLDRRLGVTRPSMPPFTLNSAVDTLLKKEFDHYRASGTPHPLIKQNGIQAVPFAHDQMDEWREALRGGVRYLHPNGLELTGAPDDLWINPEGELIVVDYKATSKQDEVSLDAEWQLGYKRQVEFYQYLLRKNGFTVNNTAYFVYANGLTSSETFNHCLHFSIKVLAHHGDNAWVEPTITALYATLQSDTAPDSSPDCEWCAYRLEAQEKENAPKQTRLL